MTKKIRIVGMIIVILLAALAVFYNGNYFLVIIKGETIVEYISSGSLIRSDDRIFYKYGKEVAREIFDDEENSKKLGTIPDGRVTFYYDNYRRINSKKYMESEYKNNMLNGISKGFHINGAIKFEKNYKNGKLDGVIKKYSPEGKLIYEGDAKDNCRIFIDIFDYANSKIRSVVMLLLNKDMIATVKIVVSEANWVGDRWECNNVIVYHFNSEGRLYDAPDYYEEAQVVFPIKPEDIIQGLKTNIEISKVLQINDINDIVIPKFKEQ